MLQAALWRAAHMYGTAPQAPINPPALSDQRPEIRSHNAAQLSRSARLAPPCTAALSRAARWPMHTSLPAGKREALRASLPPFENAAGRAMLTCVRLGAPRTGQVRCRLSWRTRPRGGEPSELQGFPIRNTHVIRNTLQYEYNTSIAFGRYVAMRVHVNLQACSLQQAPSSQPA